MRQAAVKLYKSLTHQRSKIRTPVWVLAIVGVALIGTCSSANALNKSCFGTNFTSNKLSPKREQALSERRNGVLRARKYRLIALAHAGCASLSRLRSSRYDRAGGIKSSNFLIKMTAGTQAETSSCLRAQLVRWKALGAFPLFDTPYESATANEINAFYIIALGKARGAAISTIVRSFKTCADIEQVSFNEIHKSFPAKSRHRVITTNLNVASGQSIPNDQRFSEQWALYNTGQNVGLPGSPVPRPEGYTYGAIGADIHALEAWASLANPYGPGPLVAVVDTGVATHPEFGNRLQAGIVACLPGDLSCPPTSIDTHGHGTEMTGIIAARGDIDGSDPIGIAGVSWGARILPVRVSIGGTVDILHAAKGIDQAALAGAKIINVSLQFSQNNPALEAAINRAHDRGAIVVCATGNSAYETTVAWPAKYENCLAVAGTDHHDQVWYQSGSVGSNRGPEVDIAAPAYNIISTSLNNSYTLHSGTSESTAHVSGAAALILSKNPDLSSDQIRNILLSSTDSVSCDDATGTFKCDHLGKNYCCGAGRLNLARALEMTPQPSHSIAIEVELEGLSPSVVVNRNVTVTLTNCALSAPDIRNIAMNFTAGMATATIENVDAQTDFISAQEGHSLRRLLPVNSQDQNTTSAIFKGGSKLLAGDFMQGGKQNNSVDLMDFQMLQNAWNQAIDPNANFGGDITGDGIQGNADYSILQSNWGRTGDLENACP